MQIFHLWMTYAGFYEMIKGFKTILVVSDSSIKTMNNREFFLLCFLLSWSLYFYLKCWRARLFFMGNLQLIDLRLLDLIGYDTLRVKFVSCSWLIALFMIRKSIDFDFNVVCLVLLCVKSQRMHKSKPIQVFMKRNDEEKKN